MRNLAPKLETKLIVVLGTPDCVGQAVGALFFPTSRDLCVKPAKRR